MLTALSFLGFKGRLQAFERLCMVRHLDVRGRGHFLFHHVYVASVGSVQGLDVGLGLFAREPILRGTVLGEYTGAPWVR